MAFFKRPKLPQGTRPAAPSPQPHTDSFLVSDEAQALAEAYQTSVDTEYAATGKLPTSEELQRCPVEFFRYQPLDHAQRSIRLIHLLPDLSPMGLIQCRISHASIGSSYVCLSYVWDVPIRHEASRPRANPNVRLILVNGQPFRIRQNLFNFLRMAQRNGTRNDWDVERLDLSTPIWIDALCIDQSNISERNHQVKQMGDLYSRAQSVQVWLGTWEPDDSTLQMLPKYDGSWSYLEKILDFLRCGKSGSNSLFQPGDYSCRLALCRFIFENSYWQRAWVVQEFCLATSLTIWIHTYPLSMQSVRRLWDFMVPGFWSSGYIEAEHYRQYHDDKWESLRPDLVTALHQFQHKRCANPRDRVYSLLSLCPSDSISIAVDYSISLSRLAYEILHYQGERLCFCMAALVAHSLLKETIIDDSTPLPVLDGPWIEFHVSTLEEYHPTLRYIDLDEFCIKRKPRFRISKPVVRIPLCILPTLMPEIQEMCADRSGIIRLGWGESDND